ncbi:EAL domain-containing protein [Vallitaleaceae bacterium 9-2]
MRKSKNLEGINEQLQKIDKEYKEFVDFRKTIQPKREAIRFSFIYLLVGCFWILFSDQLALAFSPTQEFFQRVQLFKGWFYVVLTGVLFGSIIFKRMRLFELAITELVKEYEMLSLADEELLSMDEAIQAQYKEIEQQKNALLVSDERYQLAVEGANDGIWEWDIEKDRFFISPKVSEILGIEDQDIENAFEPWLERVHPQEWEQVKERMAKYLESQSGIYEDTYRIRNSEGDYIWILSHGKAIWNHIGKPIRVAGSYTNVTEQMQNQEKLHQLAFYDQLTGLPNRSMLIERIEQEIQKDTYQEQKIGFLYLDIDDFKQINDTIGHDFGDEFICKIARFLEDEVNENAMVARLGGDEFGIAFFRLQDKREVETVAQRLLERIKQPWILQNNEFYVGVSIGITYYPEFGVNASALLQNSDIAMFVVKENGKDGYRIYDPKMHQRTWNYIKMNSQLRTAIENNEFSLYYQPQVDLKTHKVIGVEALIRWNHPQNGFIPPMKFIPFAEETGQIYAIGEWVVNTACAKRLYWEQHGLGTMKMSINISSKRLAQDDVVDKIKHEIATHKIKGNCIELEITETAIMDNIERAIEVIHELKALGVTIALDDFGTGYSSLTYLQRLPIDVLKVDRMFIKDIMREKEVGHIFKFITQLAHELGLKIVAEGVETKEQLEFLKDNGCDIIQGYYYSKPVPSDAIEKVIEQINNLDR